MHSYNKLWAHVVFATKNRSPFITPAVEGHLYPYLHECITEQGCVVSIINGMPNHVHLLFLQNPLRSMADVIKNIKRNSSHWINQNEICPSAFHGNRIRCFFG